MAVATTGFFDGVHLGHRRILETVVSSARERGEEALVFTFWPHPRTVLQQGEQDLRLLSSLEEKIQRIRSFGIDRVEVLPFDRAFAALTARQYLSLLSERYGVTCLVMGYDNRLGSDRLGAEALKGAFSVRSVPGLALKEDEFVSSTSIRNHLREGDVAGAAKMLGYQYGLCGTVVEGDHPGRTFGFPTANIRLSEPMKLIPSDGVYAVRAELDGLSLRGLCHIGVRPAVGGEAPTVETHLFDFREKIDGRKLSLFFIQRIRDERLLASYELF